MDQSLVARTRKAFSGAEDVREKVMFGSVGFMVNGKLCVGARESRIMCRIDPAQRDALLARRGCHPMTMKGREYRGYVLVDSAALRTDEDLQLWVGLALDFNARLVSADRGR